MTSRGLPLPLGIRTRRGAPLFWVALFVLSLLLQYVVAMQPRPVLATVDPNLFELDGNAITDHAGSGLPDDWDRVFGGTSNAQQTVFVPDAFNSTTDNIFLGGGSKDPNPISQWAWTSQKPQGKNDIEHAFAAAYTNPSNGHVIAYFGLDRYATDGDGFVGFWFFKNPVAAASNGTFTGSHTDGDILIQANFTVGGSISTFLISKWQGGGLVPVASNSVDCSSAASGNEACGIVNSTGVASPWSYTPKSGNANQFPTSAFFEGGLDLTVAGLDLGCFSTFTAETRSSQSLTSTLSDFALGNFSFCASPGISTTLSASSVPVGSSVHDSAALNGQTATAGGTVTYTAYRDSSCSQAFADAGTVNVVNGIVPDSNAIAFNLAGTYYWQAAYSGDARNQPSKSACTDEILTVVQHPAISITKLPHSQTIESGGTATWTITVTNTGDVALTNVNVTDPLAADCVKTFSGSLAPGASEAAYTCTLSGITADMTNIATAHGTPPVGADVTASDSADVTVLSPSTTLTTASVAPGTQVTPGTSVTITVTEKNTGNDTLSNVSVSGTGCSSFSPVGSFSGSLAPGASQDFSCTFAPTVTTDWSATGRGTDSLQNAVSLTGETTGGTVTVAEAPSISITKLPHSQTIESGGTATWTITVTNTGDVALTNVNVTDPLAADCVKTFSGSLAPGASEAAYTCTLSGITADMTNIATAHGTPPVGADVTASDSAAVTVRRPSTPPPPVTQFGSLVVQKTLAGDLTGFAGATFSFTVDCPAQAIHKTVSITASSGTTSAAPIVNLLPGTVCTVTENGPLPAAGGSATWGPIPGPVTAAPIQANGTTTVNITNTRAAGGVAGATSSPKPTPPPTDTNGKSNGGEMNFALVLLGLAGMTALFGLFTPAPARIRRRSRY